MRASRPGPGNLAALTLILLAGAACRSAPTPEIPRNLLLISIETTRADHLGAYGYSRRTSPRIDHLAEIGVLFEKAMAVSPRTTPSVASILTSLYPHEHGVRNLLQPLGEDNLTLAEILQGAGYATGVVQTHYSLRSAAGFAQGFDTYHDASAAERPADQATRIAAEWIRRASEGDRPWFLWLHLLDPHWKYEPPPSLRSLFGPEDPRPWQLYTDVAEGRRTIGSVIFENSMPADEVAAFVDLYDAEIRFADASIGTLLDRLDELGLSERTVVVFTADHGESLGEHDYFFEHGDFGMEPEIHVPVILVAPGLLPAGLRLPWTVSNIDIAPTILELLRAPAEARFRGRSLLPLIRGDDVGDRPCFGETGKRFHQENRRREVDGPAGKWRWLREGRFKMFYVPRANGSIDLLLHDLETDPGELDDVKADHTEVARSFRDRLKAWVAEDRGPEVESEMSEEELEQLRSLGYIN